MDAPTIRRLLADFFRFSPKDFNVQGSLTGFMVGLNPQRVPSSLLRLQTVVASSNPPMYGVYYGELNGEAPEGFDPSNNPLFKKETTNGHTFVFLKIPCVWDTSFAFWKRTASPITVESANGLPDGTNGFAYCPIANIVVEDGKITTCSPSDSGDQVWSRLPSPTIFVADFTRR